MKRLLMLCVMVFSIAACDRQDTCKTEDCEKCVDACVITCKLTSGKSNGYKCRKTCQCTCTKMERGASLLNAAAKCI